MFVFQVREIQDRNKPHCFELYACGDIIKACKTDSEGKVSIEKLYDVPQPNVQFASVALGGTSIFCMVLNSQLAKKFRFSLE